MPKNSSDYLTNNYGFITDYLAEAFHYVFQHTNRYEEVTKRIRLGATVEGRDEKGIKKTVAAFLKILHPATSPTDREFEEYVAYAVESRRRIKEQMNKRKPDDEFANINLSYLDAGANEIVVFCPESQNAPATQNPNRQDLNASPEPRPRKRSSKATSKATSQQTRSPDPMQEEHPPQDVPPVPPELTEQHFTIYYGDTGHSYDSLFSPYLQGAKVVTVEDPYIRAPHQIANFVRFCETVVKVGTVKRIELIMGYDEDTVLSEIQDKLNDLKQRLLELDIVLDITLNANLHDREIRLDHGWTIKIGRGLDFYQKPESWFGIGSQDMSLRKCLETKVDIFRAEP
jgi:ATP-dependent Lon protease